MAIAAGVLFYIDFTLRILEVYIWELSSSCSLKICYENAPTQPVLMILTKVYPCHNRCKQPVLMIPTKVYLGHNRSFAVGFDDLVKT